MKFGNKYSTIHLNIHDKDYLHFTRLILISGEETMYTSCASKLSKYRSITLNCTGIYKKITIEMIQNLAKISW